MDFYHWSALLKDYLKSAPSSKSALDFYSPAEERTAVCSACLWEQMIGSPVFSLQNTLHQLAILVLQILLGATCLSLKLQKLSILAILPPWRDSVSKDQWYIPFPSERQIRRLTLSQQICHQVCSLPIKLSACFFFYVLSRNCCPAFTFT